jgi:hypothetical protein
LLVFDSDTHTAKILSRIGRQIRNQIEKELKFQPEAVARRGLER